MVPGALDREHPNYADAKNNSALASTLLPDPLNYAAWVLLPADSLNTIHVPQLATQLLLVMPAEDETMTQVNRK